MSEKPKKVETGADFGQPDETVKCSQAERIIAKFGGVSALVAVLDRIGRTKHRVSIYKWMYPREKGGTGGIIPTAAWPDIFAAARVEGVLITPEDIDPRPTYKSKSWNAK